MSEKICSAEGCGRPFLARGWCRSHYKRWRRAINITDLRRSVAQRFWARIDPCRTDGCWLWLGTTDRYGYGQFKANGKKHFLAHHFLVGKPPVGLEWDHLCRVTACVCPDHLEAVTHAENVRRGAAGEHWRNKTHCPYGHEYTPENTYLNHGRRFCRMCWARRRQGQTDSDRSHINERMRLWRAKRRVLGLPA